MAASLSSRAIIGEYFAALEADLTQTWTPAISNYFTSDQESETYKWLGQVPQLREWIGGRHAKGLRTDGITVANKPFEATLEVGVDEIRRDKTEQVMVRVRELAQRTNSHWAKLLSALIENGATTACYDGQYFFDTDHSEGESGTQSNSISSDITTTTAPTAGEMETGILKGIQQILGFKDNEGEPMNESAREFLVMVPLPYMSSAASAIGSTVIVDTAGVGGRSNTIITLGAVGGFAIKLAVNPRLTWTTKFAVFRSDSPIRSLIRQEEEKVTMAAIAEGSELEFNDNLHRYGVKALRNVGYGLWQRACLVTHT